MALTIDIEHSRLILTEIKGAIQPVQQWIKGKKSLTWEHSNNSYHIIVTKNASTENGKKYINYDYVVCKNNGAVPQYRYALYWKANQLRFVADTNVSLVKKGKPNEIGIQHNSSGGPVIDWNEYPSKSKE